jgi:hypothetical protein
MCGVHWKANSNHSAAQISQKPQSISCLDTHQFSNWQLRYQTHHIRHEECSRIISVPWVADCMGKTPRGLNQSEQMTLQTADDGIHCEFHQRCTEDLLHLGLQNEQRIIEKPKCTTSFTQAWEWLLFDGNFTLHHLYRNSFVNLDLHNVKVHTDRCQWTGFQAWGSTSSRSCILQIYKPATNFYMPAKDFHPNKERDDEVWHTRLCAQWHAMWQETTASAIPPAPNQIPQPPQSLPQLLLMIKTIAQKE